MRSYSGPEPIRQLTPRMCSPMESDMHLLRKKLVLFAAAVVIFGVASFFISAPGKQKVNERATDVLGSDRVLLVAREALDKYRAENSRSPERVSNIMNIECESNYDGKTTLSRLVKNDPGYVEKLVLPGIGHADAAMPDLVAYVPLRHGGYRAIFNDGRLVTIDQLSVGSATSAHGPGMTTARDNR